MRSSSSKEISSGSSARRDRTLRVVHYSAAANMLTKHPEQGFGTGRAGTHPMAKMPSSLWN